MRGVDTGEEGERGSRAGGERGVDAGFFEQSRGKKSGVDRAADIRRARPCLEHGASSLAGPLWRAEALCRLWESNGMTWSLAYPDVISFKQPSSSTRISRHRTRPATAGVLQPSAHGPHGVYDDAQSPVRDPAALRREGVGRKSGHGQGPRHRPKAIMGLPIPPPPPPPASRARP